MFELTVRDEISAAHFLRGYQGKCANLHGHTFRVAVTVAGDTLNEVGLMMDLVDMKRHLKTLVDRLDHVCLNDLEFFKVHNPSSENLAKYLYAEYKSLIAPVRLVKVRVWESEKADVIYYE